SGNWEDLVKFLQTARKKALRATWRRSSSLPWPKQIALPNWKSSSTDLTTLTSSRLAMGVTMRKCMKPPSCYTTTSPPLGAWRRLWSTSGSTRLLWMVPARPTAPGPGKKCALRVWMGRNSDWPKCAVCTLWSMLMNWKNSLTTT
ncbi:unnamed protein product, partial [Tetraodon nigroviridis]